MAFIDPDEAKPAPSTSGGFIDPDEVKKQPVKEVGGRYHNIARTGPLLVVVLLTLMRLRNNLLKK